MITATITILVTLSIVVGGFAAHYKEQRDDIIDLWYSRHPEDFKGIIDSDD